MQVLGIKIQEKLCEQIVIHEDHRHFLSHAFGLETSTEIHDFLLRDSEETLTFMDWLLFPDLAFQLRIESVLDGGHIFFDQQSRMIEQLISENIKTNIQIDNKLETNISLNPEIIANYVYRLGLTRIIPEKLRTIRFTDNHQKYSVWIQLRNDEIHWTDQSIDFVYQIIEGYQAKPQERHDILAYAIKLCSECKDTTDYFDQLKKKKHTLIQNIQRFQHAQALQEKFSMEFLITSGVRAAHVDIVQTNAEIAIIDQILMEVFDFYELNHDYVETSYSISSGIA